MENSPQKRSLIARLKNQNGDALCGGGGRRQDDFSITSSQLYSNVMDLGPFGIVFKFGLVLGIYKVRAPKTLKTELRALPFRFFILRMRALFCSPSKRPLGFFFLRP